MNSKKNIVLLILISFFIGGCLFVYDPPSKIDRRLKINNTSSETVFYLIMSKSELDSQTRVFNHQIFNYKSSNGNYKKDTVFYRYRILPKELDTVEYIGNYQETIKEAKNQRLKIYFFKESTIESRKWLEIVDKNLYDVKKEYEIDELEKMEWIVNYP